MAPGGTDRWLTSGVSSLDRRLGGGLARGDNVLWLTHRATALTFCTPFIQAEPDVACWMRSARSTSGDGARENVDVELDRPGIDVPGLVESVVNCGRSHRRLVVDLLDDAYLRLGATAVVELYTQACPQLFDMGVVAYWPLDREVLPATVVERISRVAQVVLEVRPESLRVQKAEGRPISVQGALSALGFTSSGLPIVGREMGAGRLAEGLRRLRRERNLSQKQLADLADVTPSAISQAETARRNLSLETLLTLCDRLPTTIDELLGMQATPRRLLARREGRVVATNTVAVCDSPGLRTSIYRVQLPPREAGAPFVSHRGTETILVARGLVLVDLGDDTPVLRAGDALVVTRDPVRGWTNLTNEPAELFWLLDSAELGASEA
jgi:transcriptional regulator with XRE-family HTH domain